MHTKNRHFCMMLNSQTRNWLLFYSFIFHFIISQMQELGPLLECFHVNSRMFSQNLGPVGRRVVNVFAGKSEYRMQKVNKLMRPKTNILRGWYTGMYTKIANTKQAHMDKNRFENIIVEFAPKFESLKTVGSLAPTCSFSN
jgi:hypothetical protein